MRNSKPKAAGRVPRPNASARIGARLAPPEGLLDRVRWVFLLFSLLMAAVVFGLILGSEVTPLALRLAALSAIVGLVWWWIRGYARGGFPFFGIVFEGTAIFAAALATGVPPTALGLLYSSLMFRSLFGPLRNVVVLLVAYLSAFYGAAALALSFTYLDLPFATILPEPLGLPLVAVTLHALAATIRSQERTVSREQTLREAGAELVKALDREEIYGAVLAGAIRLAQDVPRTRASFAIGAPESMTIVASAGEGAEAVEGRRFDLRDLPEEIRDPVLDKASPWMHDANPLNMRKALGLEPKVGSVLYVPLLVEGEVNGVLVVASDGKLPEDMKGSLDTLGSQAALALENVARAEDLYRKKNEERLQALLQNASDLITVVDAEGTIIYESPSVKTLLGYEPEEVVGMGMTDLLHPKDVEKVRDLFARISAKPGVSPGVEVRARHRDGSWRQIEAVANNLLHDPNLRGIVVNSRDVTGRRRAEEASRESEAGLVAAQRIARLGSWDAGPLGAGGLLGPQQEIRWSEEMYRVLGHEPGSFAPNVPALVVAIHPEDKDRVLEAVRLSTLGREEELEIEHRIVRPDGETRRVRARIATVYGEDGEPESGHGTMLDVTESKKVEDALRRSESELAAAQRLAHVGNWVFEGDLDEARWSDETFRILGLDPQSFVPSVRHFVASVHPDDRPSFEEYVSDLSGRFADGLEHRIVRPDGEVRVVHNRREVERDAVGRPLREAGTVQDVTEQREAEHRLREAESKYRTLIEQLPAVIYIQDFGSDVLSYTSPQLEGLLGYSPEEYLKNPTLFAETIHPDDRDRVLAEDRRTDSTGEPYIVECRRITRDGRVVWVHDEAHLVRDAQGRPLYWQGILTDITTRRRSEEAFRQSEERHRAVVEQAVEGIYLVDLDTKRILESNPAFRRLLGRTGEELSGMTLYDIVAHDKGSVDAQVRRVAEDGFHGIGERRHRRKDGSLVDVEVSASLISYRGRGALSCVAHDITERKRAERALRESEEMFRAVFENAATGVTLTDRNGRFVRVNAALARFLGFEAQELRGMAFIELTHADDVEPNVGSLRRLLAGEIQRYRLEKRYLRKDGTYVWAHVTVSGIRDADGGIRYVLGLIEDITERKRAEEEIRQLNEDLERRVAERTSQLRATITDLERAQSALRRGEARTRAIVETAPDAIFTMAEDGLIRSFNSGAERMFGYATGEILGRPLTTLMPERLRAAHERGFARHLETGEGELIGQGPVEMAGLRRDGTEFPLELALGELREEGEVLFTGIVRDITERKEAGKKIREAEERYRTLVERMPAVTYIQEIGSPDSAMYMSPQIEELTGYKPEDCRDPELQWRMVHPADRERLRFGDGQAGEAGEVTTNEYRVLRRDGRTVWVRNESILIEDEASGSRYWHGFMVDVTERKRAEASLRAYAEKLQRSNRELQDFAYVASHDLQEPLRKVSSFGERLRTKFGDVLGDQGLDYLGRMEGATVRMQGLIEDLLSLSRVTTRANPFEPVDLAAVVPEVLSDLEARLEETGGAVEVGQMPTVEADGAQMRQLLQNLIGNALKFHKAGEPPLVRVYCEPADGAPANGGHPRRRLVVEDNGIGFDEEHFSRIFVPFERLHGRGAYEGTGMGLAICRKVVERHGGEITAESAPGRGARFVITLPTKQIEEVSAGEEER